MIRKTLEICQKKQMWTDGKHSLMPYFLAEAKRFFLFVSEFWPRLKKDAFFIGARILDSSMKRNSNSLSQTKEARKTPIKMDGEEKTVWNKQGKETKTFKKRPATQSKSW